MYTGRRGGPPRRGHRRHLHRPRRHGRGDRCRARRQGPHHAEGPRARRGAGHPGAARRGAGGPGRGERGGPRHHARDQRAHRAQGGEDRAADDRGLPGRPRDPARGPLRHVRPLHRPARAARPASPAARGARAPPRRRLGAAAARRGRRAARHRRARRRGRRGARDLPPARLREPGPRATARRAGPRARPADRRRMLIGGRARDPRIRARLHDHGERLRRTAHGALSRGPRAPARRPRRPGPALHHAVRGRDRAAAARAPPADPPRRVGPRRRCPRRGPGRARAGRAAAPLVRHGRHHGQGVRDRRWCPARRPRVRGGARRPLQEGLGAPDPRARHRADRDRRGRRLDRARGPHGPAQGRSRQRRRRPGSGVLRPRGPPADGHRRRPPARLPRRRVLPGRAHAAGPRGGAPRRRGARGAAARPRRDRGGVGDPPGRQREHGRRRAHPRHRARPRPPAVPALRLRGRGARPLLAGREGPQGPAPPAPVRRGRDVGLGSARRPARIRLRPHRPPAARPGRLACDQPAVRGHGDRGARAPHACGRGAGRRARGAGRRDALRRPGPRGRVPRARGDALRGEPPRDHRGLRGRLPRALPPAAPGRADRGAQLARDGRGPGAGQRARRAYFAEAGGFVETPVYDRYALEPGSAFSGPAIVEERESTAVLGPGARCRVDAGLALVVEVPA